MIFDSFGNMVNDDGSMINQPLMGSVVDLGNSANTFSGGGNIRNVVYFGTDGQVFIDGPNDRYMVNDGVNDRILIGKGIGLF